MAKLNIHPSRVGYASAILCALLVGSISTASKPVITNVNPLLYASLVYLLASLAPIPFSRKIRISNIARKDWLFIFAIAFCGAIVAPALFFTGLQQTTASDTAVLSNAETIFTVLLALIFFRERLRSVGYLAIGMVIVGLVIVTTNLQFSNFLLDIRKEGNLFILGSMAFWALDNNLSKIASHRIELSRLVQLKCAIGGTVLLVVSLVGGIPFNINLVQVPNLLLVGVVGFGISLYLFLNSLRRIGTVKTMLIYSTSTLFGLLFASSFLHEHIGAYQILAISLMLAGIYLITKEGQSVEKIQL